MASLTIRRLSEETKQKLRLRAAANQRSMEEEVRRILEDATRESKPGESFLARVRSIVGEGFELELPSRDEMPRDPFADWDDKE